ncbi:MAG: hypothetical protein U9P71_04660 [Campylobacterota bacterium]|nr:hypothetical protein [Campylobacterota bacterium]
MSRRRGGLFSLGTILGSFFGAAMIAAAFAYFNYKFSEYKFINFNEWVFYSQKEIFTPIDERYIVIFFSSKSPNTVQLIKESKSNYPIIAIDYYQQSFSSKKNITFLRSGTNTMLKLIQRFNIYKSPSVFIIKKNKDKLYKQDSMIRELDTLKKLSKKIEEL